ncbi:hypothetical protein GHT99_08095 [Citrobacter koseri]|uniref:hypothetical protein n=1 Tax=Citrobacter koseri TaxID=545 RepID=UPI0019037BD6|nr:hypothetical protein [Citrobacter koseri]MBJ9171581.1 hypothetical protein [Citrobacter koseri]HEM6670377.1 hypothetical protein [Citrobacter koseri]
MAYDIINGQKVPQTVITENKVLTGEHRGTVKVISGELTIIGSLHGTLSVEANASVRILGSQHGTIGISSGASVVIEGNAHGTVSVSPGATLVIEECGLLMGTLNNNGVMVLRGVYGGAQSGSQKIILEGNGYIKQPQIIDGVHYYY